MSTHLHQPHSGARRFRWWHAMRIRERVLLVGVLLAMLVISAALIYYGPGLETMSSTSPAAPAATSTTPGPMYPPGTRWYYRRGQWFPPAVPQP